MRLRFLVASAALLGSGLSAHATLLGNTIDATEVLGGITYDLGTFTDPGAVVGHDGVAQFAVGASSVGLTFGRSATFPAGTTFTFTDLTGPTGITNILLASSTVPGLTMSDVTFNSNSFTFNLSNIAATVGESATFNLNFAAAPASVTPEPSSLALLGTGVLGIFGAARRRFSRS